MKVLLLISMLALAGCASVAQEAVDERMVELKQKIDPLVGKTEEDIVLTLGAPATIEQAAGIKIYKYYQSFGRRGIATYGGNLSNGSSWEMYDKYDIFFKDGKMMKWTSYIQR